MKLNIAVIGAGICGVATAYNIQQCLPEAQVTIISDQFSPNTTSDVAAGFWYPHLLKDTPEDLQRRWGRKTLDHLKKLFMSSDASSAGVLPVSGYWLFSGEEKAIDALADDFEGFRRLGARELEMWPEYRTGVFFTTYMCEGAIYLPWLLNKYCERNGRVIKRKLDGIKELFDTYDIVVNCAGIGAAKLVGDTSLEPIRGQLLRIKAPWLKHFHIFDSGHLSAFPCMNNVAVGGTLDYGKWDLKPDPTESQRIWSQICSQIPALKKATIEKETCGLRPSRAQVRLETELVHHHNRVIPVIHNYGHGGAGITLHWGCALEAADMVKHAMQTLPVPTSRL